MFSRYAFERHYLVILVSLGAIASGCSSRQLTEESAEEILQQDNVRTVRDFFQHASGSLSDGKDKNWLGDIDTRVTEFQTGEEYFDQQLRDAAATVEFANDVEKVLERFIDVTNWKTKERDLKVIHRVYSVIVKQPFTEMIQHVDGLARVEIYTDKEGRILGWRQPFRDIVFTE